MMRLKANGAAMDPIRADEALAKHVVGLDAKPTGRVRRTTEGVGQAEWHGRFGTAWIDMPQPTEGDAGC